MDNSAYLLSMLRAMLLHITPNLRVVKLDIIDDLFNILFYYDKKPCEEEVDLAENCHTEFISDFPSKKCELKIYVIPFPDSVPDIGYSVYRRYEGKFVINACLEQKAQNALIECVTDNLRAVQVHNQDNLVILSLFYEKSLDNKEKKLIETIEERFKNSISKNWNSVLKVEVIPYPLTIPEMGFTVFKRFEN